MRVPYRRLRRGIAVRLRAKVAQLFGGVMNQYTMPESLPSGTYSCTYACIRSRSEGLRLNLEWFDVMIALLLKTRESVFTDLNVALLPLRRTVLALREVDLTTSWESTLGLFGVFTTRNMSSLPAVQDNATTEPEAFSFMFFVFR